MQAAPEAEAAGAAEATAWAAPGIRHPPPPYRVTTAETAAIQQAMVQEEEAELQRLVKGLILPTEVTAATELRAPSPEPLFTMQEEAEEEARVEWEEPEVLAAEPPLLHHAVPASPAQTASAVAAAELPLPAAATRTAAALAAPVLL